MISESQYTLVFRPPHATYPTLPPGTPFTPPPRGLKTRRPDPSAPRCRGRSSPGFDLALDSLARAWDSLYSHRQGSRGRDGDSTPGPSCKGVQLSESENAP